MTPAGSCARAGRPLTPLRRGRAGLRGRTARGAMFLYFGLIMLPAMFFGAAMSVDFTRIIIASREMHSAAQAAAQAGAYQFQAGSSVLNATAAQSAARGTLLIAVNSGETHLSDFSAADAAGVTPQVDSGLTTVTVTLTYNVPGLAFVHILGALLGSGQSSTDSHRTVTAEAFVCNPSVSTGPTQGFCVRPGAWN